MQGNAQKVYEEVEKSTIPQIGEVLRCRRVWRNTEPAPLSSHSFWTLSYRERGSGKVLDSWFLDAWHGRALIDELCRILRDEEIDSEGRRKIRRKKTRVFPEIERIRQRLREAGYGSLVDGEREGSEDSER